MNNLIDKLNNLREKRGITKQLIKEKNASYEIFIEKTSKLINYFNNKIEVEFNNDEIEESKINITRICNEIKTNFLLNKHIKDDKIKEISKLENEIKKLDDEINILDNELKTSEEIKKLLNNELKNHFENMKNYGGYKNDILCYICQEYKVFIPYKINTNCQCEYLICYHCMNQLKNINYNNLKCIICKNNNINDNNFFIKQEYLIERLDTSLKNFNDNFKKKYKYQINAVNCSKCNLEFNSLANLDTHNYNYHQSEDY